MKDSLPIQVSTIGFAAQFCARLFLPARSTAPLSEPFQACLDKFDWLGYDSIVSSSNLLVWNVRADRALSATHLFKDMNERQPAYHYRRTAAWILHCHVATVPLTWINKPLRSNHLSCQHTQYRVEYCAQEFQSMSA